MDHTHEEVESQTLSENVELVKLSKNSRGYNWEIKLLGIVDEAQLYRLATLNMKMEATYGSNPTA